MWAVKQMRAVRMLCVAVVARATGLSVELLMFRACAAVIRAGLLCVLVFCLSILFFLLSARLATRYTIPQCSAGPLTTRHTASPLPCNFASSIFPPLRRLPPQ